MRASQREPGVVVVERRRGPTARCMADRAVGRESRCDVVRIRGPVVVRLVARVTGGRSIGVIVIRVALGAGQRGMNASQRIVGVLRVVEVDIRPVDRGVARFACGREARSRMVWIRGAVPIRLMTTEARRG